MIFGARYESDAILPDGTPPPKVANPVTDYEATARPGSRAPHVWIERNGSRASTLDLLGGQRFTLLAGPDGRSWCHAAQVAADRLHVPLEALAIDATIDAEPRWPAAYGIERDGAVMVRPDGYVGWRRVGSVSDPTTELTRALARILGQEGQAAT